MFETTMPELRCPCAVAVYSLRLLTSPQKMYMALHGDRDKELLNKIDTHAIQVPGQ